MQEEQWADFLQRLIDGSLAAIDQFATTHPTEEICYFAYDSEPCYGYVLTCFNTTNANSRHVQEWHQRNTSYRKKLLANPTWRDSAYYKVKTNCVLPFCNNTGDFAYQGFTEIKFPEWDECARSDKYPERLNHQDDYLESRVALIFAQALDTLAEGGSFEKLRLASPTLLGFGFHDHDQYVVRMLKLPSS
ncbi:MAG: hypothetical protein H0T51_19595 [Pirellulales bacterium]|nr:hypothetical protein [Pirellulales bacterium]